MKGIQEKIIADLKWLAEKTEDPIVSITYSMSISIVKMHFESTEIKNVKPVGNKNPANAGHSISANSPNFTGEP